MPPVPEARTFWVLEVSRLETLRESEGLNQERITTLRQEIEEGDQERLELSSKAMDMSEKVAAEVLPGP